MDDTIFNTEIYHFLLDKMDLVHLLAFPIRPVVDPFYYPPEFVQITPFLLPRCATNWSAHDPQH